MSEGRQFTEMVPEFEDSITGFGAQRKRPSYCCSHGFRHYFLPASLPRYGARQMNGRKCKRGFPALKKLPFFPTLAQMALTGLKWDLGNAH